MRKVLPIILLSTSLGLLAACDTASPCDVRPTSVGTDGLCYEADQELCDDDPCDADDDDAKHKVRAPGVVVTKKPVPVSTRKPGTSTRRTR